MGLVIALTVILLWAFHLLYLLILVDLSSASPIILVHMAIQTYLYTGLFITAHDAMHGLVSPDKAINKKIGRLATRLFAALSFSRLLEKHQLHHQFPGEAADPDYSVHSQNFWLWWFSFMKNYISWWQIIIMALLFNILHIWVKSRSAS